VTPDEKASTPQAFLFVGGPGERAVGAAELERADALEVLALEEHLGAGARATVREVSNGVRWAWPAMRAAAAATSAYETGSGWEGAFMPPI
jgi:hypothetical protein